MNHTSYDLGGYDCQNMMPVVSLQLKVDEMPWKTRGLEFCFNI